jgi:hypothetical protein
MKVDGILLAMLDIPAEQTRDYNRWYDLDHMPEHISKGDVLHGRRYVASRTLRATPGIEVPEFGYTPYLTTYLFGGPIDFAGEESAALWHDKDFGIVREGRYWRDGRSVLSTRWRLERATARPSCLVSEQAVPYLAHRGVIVALGKAPSAARREEAVTWWERTHLVDLFGVVGVLAALRFSNAESATPTDDVLYLLLCDEPTSDVLARIEKMKRYARAVGRYPAHRDAYRSLAFLPYDTIYPLQYDFDV